MKRVLYGTWTQINYLIKQNNNAKLLDETAGYDYYEVVPVLAQDLPTRAGYDVKWPDVTSEKSTIPTPSNPMFDDYINYHQMNNPKTVAQQFAKRTGTPLEYFMITLYN